MLVPWLVVTLELRKFEGTSILNFVISALAAFFTVYLSAFDDDTMDGQGTSSCANIPPNNATFGINEWQSSSSIRTF